jgi:hypothetical protein
MYKKGPIYRQTSASSFHYKLLPRILAFPFNILPPSSFLLHHEDHFCCYGPFRHHGKSYLAPPRTPSLYVLSNSQAVAVSIPETQNQHLRRSPASDLPTVNLTVTDPRFPGRTFHGTAKSVYHQMVALNATVFDDEKAGARSLKKRAGEVSSAAPIPTRSKQYSDSRGNRSTAVGASPSAPSATATKALITWRRLAMQAAALIL